MSERRFRRTLGGVCSLGAAPGVVPEVPAPSPGGRCGELLEPVAAEHSWEIVAKEVMPDHMHLFVRVGPTAAPASGVRAFEGRTARVLRAEFPYLCRFAKVLWSRSHFDASAAVEQRVRRVLPPG